MDSWLNITSSFKGDTIIINRDMKSEAKLLSATTLTTHMSNSRDLIDRNNFYPRVLIATSICVWYGLDYSFSCSVIRVWFTASMIGMSQEKSRRGRTHRDDGTNQKDKFSCFYCRKTLCVLMKDCMTLLNMTFLIMLQELLLTSYKLCFNEEACWRFF